MEKEYKRTSRSVPQEVRTKISNSMKGIRKPESVKSKISQGLKRYWGNDDNFPDDNKTTIEDLI